MNVVIDVGNSRINWASVEQGALVGVGNALHIDSLDRAFETLAYTLPKHVERIMVSNVAGEAFARRLLKLSTDCWSCEPEFVEPVAMQCGVRSAYGHPEQIGSDRWVNVIAAHNVTTGPACVIDAGTSVTFDAVDEGGQHLGGLIFPGLRMMISALDTKTSDISVTEAPTRLPQGISILGKSTDESVGHGVMLALATGLNRAIQLVEGELKADPKVFLTGGDAELFLPLLEKDVDHRKNLILEGLAFMISAG